MKYSIFFLLFLLGTVSPQDPAATETDDYTLPIPECFLWENGGDPDSSHESYTFLCQFSGIVKPKCATMSMEIRNGVDCKEEYDLKQHNQVVKVDNEAEGLDESDQTVYLAEAAIHPKEPKEDDVTAVLSEEEIKFCLYVKLENCEGNLMLFKEIKVTLLKGIMGTLELEGLTNAKFEDTVEETVTTNSDLKLEAYRCKKNPTDVEDVVEDPLEGNKVLNICIEIDEAAGPAEYMLGEVLELELKKEATSEADKNVFNFDRQENFNKEVVFDLFKEEQRMMVGLKLPIDFFLDVRPITASGKIALKDPISRRLLQNTNIDTAKDSKFSSKIEVSSNHDIYASSSASKSNLMVLVLFSVTTMLLN